LIVPGSFGLPVFASDSADVLNRDDGVAVKQDVVNSTLSDVGRHVSRVFDSLAAECVLCMSPWDFRIDFVVEKLHSAGVSAKVQVQKGARVEPALRQFLKERAFPTPVQIQISPHLPPELICRISPPPVGGAAITALAREMFRLVCGLSDDAQVAFCLWERV
jgi:hypothetical protein